MGAASGSERAADQRHCRRCARPGRSSAPAEIEGFCSALGVDIYQEILRRAGHSRDARTIPNADRQKSVVEWMQAAARGFERLHGLVETTGDARFIDAMDSLKFSTTSCLPSLAALKQLVEELEAISDQKVA